MRKTLEIGCFCNNAFKNEDGVHVGQSTDVALLNVLGVFGMLDLREVRSKSQVNQNVNVHTLPILDVYSHIREPLQFGTEVHGSQWSSY